MTEIKLERKDWEEMKQGAIELLKNAMAQVVVYQGQVETADVELKKFPEEPKKEEVGKLVETEEKPKVEEKTPDAPKMAPKVKK